MTKQKRGKSPPFDLAAIADRSLRGKPETKVWIKSAHEQPDEQTGEIATISGELVFARIDSRRLVMLEPGSEAWPQQGEWPNLWWSFSGTLALSHAGLVLRSLALEPMDPEDPEQDTRAFLGVNAALLRALKPDRIIQLALKAITDKREGIARFEAKREQFDYSSEWWGAWRLQDTALAGALQEAGSAYAKTRRAGGRPPLNDTHYRGVAYACIDLYKKAGGRPPRIHAALADRYHVSRKTVEAWIREARRRGFLAPGQPGRATFAPGPNLRQKREE
ncbi:MAG: hypothetical protein M3Q59_10790 [Actinomycetota bacterium]|nr:hypothetical protein [Actinomycetota bacterium]